MPVLPKIPLERGDRWVSTGEVMALFGVSHETVNRWNREQKLKGYRPSRANVYKKSDVNKLLAEKGLPTI